MGRRGIINNTMKSKDQQLLEEAYELVQLNELFESPYPFERDKDGYRGGEYETTYTFSPTGNPTSFPRYTITFTIDLQEVSLSIVFDYQEKEFSRPTMDLTGSGNASKVMGTIMAITKQYLNELIASDPDDLQYAEIAFSAKLSEEGRVKFYNTLASLLTKFLNQTTTAKQIEWSWSSIQNNTNADSSKGYFIKAKPKAVQASEKEKTVTTQSSLNKFL